MARSLKHRLRRIFREGLSVLQYFISTHGARKGLADTALKTANFRYLTRRLVDVAQDLVITDHDCGTEEGLRMTLLLRAVMLLFLQVEFLVVGCRKDVVKPGTDEVVLEAGTLIDEQLAEQIEGWGVDEVMVRSPITCEVRHGVCSKCYGRDLGRGHLVMLVKLSVLQLSQSVSPAHS